MARTIYKYPVSGMSEFDVVLPVGHKVLRVALQPDYPSFTPFIWVDVDTESETQSFRFVVMGTGHPMPSGCEYVGSWDERNGFFVWHLFEDPTGRLELPLP